MQDGVGQSASSDFIVYDTLGIPLNVRLTTVLESRDGQTSTYRWFADSGDNDPAGADHAIAVGTGLIVFDGEGNMIQANKPDRQYRSQRYPLLQPVGLQPGLLARSPGSPPSAARSPRRDRTVRPSAR